MPLLFAVAIAFAAEGIRVGHADFEAGEDGYYVDADFDITFTQVLEDALNRGVPLNFLIEFELTRPRWYWFDKTIVRAAQQRKIAYNALPRQYPVSIGSLHQSYTRLDDAKQVLSRVRDWLVTDRRLKPTAGMDAMLRMRLDVSALPKPFQINALVSKDWSLTSDWQRLSVSTP